MKRYLLVPTAPSSIAPLVERARELAFEERGVTFALITPRPAGVDDPDVADHQMTAGNNRGCHNQEGRRTEIPRNIE